MHGNFHNLVETTVPILIRKIWFLLIPRIQIGHMNRVKVDFEPLNSDFTKTFHQCSVSVTKVSSSTRFSKHLTSPLDSITYHRIRMKTFLSVQYIFQWYSRSQRLFCSSPFYSRTSSLVFHFNFVVCTKRYFYFFVIEIRTMTITIWSLWILKNDQAIRDHSLQPIWE